MNISDKQALVTPLASRLFRARPLDRLRARMHEDPLAREQLAHQLVFWLMDCLRQERFEAALVPAQEHLLLTRQRAEGDEASAVDLSRSLIMLAGVLMELMRYPEAERLAKDGVEVARASRSASGDPEADGLLRTGLAIVAACGLDDSAIDEVTNPGHGMPRDDSSR